MIVIPVINMVPNENQIEKRIDAFGKLKNAKYFKEEKLSHIEFWYDGIHIRHICVD